MDTFGNDAISLRISDGQIRLRRNGALLPWKIDTSAAEVTVRTGMSERSYPVTLSRLTEKKIPCGRRWEGEIGGAGCAFEISVEGKDAVFSVIPLATGTTTVVRAVWPGRISAEGNQREAFWSDWSGGCLFRQDGREFEWRIRWWESVMRLAGMTAAGHTLALIVETPYDAETVLCDDGSAAIAATTTFLPSLGELAYPRRLRIVPTDQTGYVSAAEAFRHYCQTHGLWKTWQARVEERPEVSKLPGAFIASAGYLADPEADHAAAMRCMRKFGFRRGYLLSPRFYTFDDDNWSAAMGGPVNLLPDSTLTEIQDLGYLCAAFLQVEEATEAVGVCLLAVDSEGKKVLRWRIGQYAFFEIAKPQVLRMLPRLDEKVSSCAAIHYDTVTAMSLIEHWGDNRYRREEDAHWRARLLEYYCRMGKAVFSEGMKDWAVPWMDCGSHRTFSPFARGGKKRVWSVPLEDLVFHDCLIRSHYEFLAWNDDSCLDGEQYITDFWPFGQVLSCSLTMSPPVLFPEGRMYRYPIRTETDPDGTRRRRRDNSTREVYSVRHTDPALAAVVPEALRVCELCERHGTSRMTKHRFLDRSSPLVQETEFSSGLRVVVNFGDEPYTAAGGKTVPARSAVTEE